MRTILGYAAGIFFTLVTVYGLYNMCRHMAAACRTRQWKNVLFTAVYFGVGLAGWACIGWFTEVWGFLRALFG